MTVGTLAFGTDANPEVKPSRVIGKRPRLIEPPELGCRVCIYRDNLCRESVDILPCEHPLVERCDSGEVREI